MHSSLRQREGQGNPMETRSWDKGCEVSCRRRHSVGEVSLQTKEKGSCMYDYVIYIHMACTCLCLWYVSKSKRIHPDESPKSSLHQVSQQSFGRKQKTWDGFLAQSCEREQGLGNQELQLPWDIFVRGTHANNCCLSLNYFSPSLTGSC